MRVILTFLAVFSLFGTALAVDTLVVESVERSSLPEDLFIDSREPSNNGLPDGKIAKISGGDDIVEAWYAEPTGRYRHGILGDRIEAGALKVRTKLGQTISHRLPRSEVFEDITPHLADLDKDGTIEVITIRSSTTRGAALTIYGLNGPLLVKKASTPFIGRANRWLNIAGIADITPGSNLEIAIVVKPHIQGIFQVIEYPTGVSIPIGFQEATSNHQIGAREQRLSATVDYNGDGKQDIAVPSLDRKSLFVVGYKDRTIQMLARAALPAPIDKAILVKGTGKDAVFTVGLDDGSVHNVHR